MELPSAFSTPSQEVETADYLDTFLDCGHLIDSFPNAVVTFSDARGEPIHIGKSPESHPQPPFKLCIQRGANGEKDHIRAVPYSATNMGPFLLDKRPRNTVRYTDRQ